MNNGSMRTRKGRTAGRSLWSRLTLALARLHSQPRAARDNAPAVVRQTPRDSNATGARISLSDRFASQLYAGLLLELPQHRQAFTSAWLAGDRQALAECAHRLAGAVAYCDLPELGAALGELENAIRHGDEPALPQAYNRASREIDHLLDKSGLR